MRSVRFRILLALCLIIGISSCSSSSPCNYLLIELTQLGLEPGQPAAGFLEALVRLDGESWLHTAKAQFPAADKWAFCAPELPAGSHELRVTLLGSRGEEQAYLGAEFNISVPSVMPAPGRITWSEPVTLRRPRLCNEHGWCWENPWPQGSPLLSVQSRDRDSVWAVGDAGTILHFNGGYWQRIPVTYSGVASGLWVDESDHAWVLLSPDHIYRCDNLECRKVGAEGSPTFNQIVGFDSEHIFAVGTNGSLYTCDRTGCQQLDSTVGVNLSSAVATANNVVYVAGDAGTVLRCEGNVCTHIGPKTGGAFNAIARDASSAIHVVGEGGGDAEVARAHAFGAPITSAARGRLSSVAG